MAKKAAKKRNGSANKVTIDLPSRPLANSDAKFEINTGGEKLGRLRISKGGVDWYPKNKKTPVKFTWKQFAARMDSKD